MSTKHVTLFSLPNNNSIENMCYFRLSLDHIAEKLDFNVFVKGEQQVIPLFHYGV